MTFEERCLVFERNTEKEINLSALLLPVTGYDILLSQSNLEISQGCL